jgi:hypothetical protein
LILTPRTPRSSSSLQPEPPLCDECGDYGACPVLPPSSSQVRAAQSSSNNASSNSATYKRPFTMSFCYSIF